MIAAALLHPDVSSNVVNRFRDSRVEIRISESLEDPENFSAALIFGGDGTIHRHLAPLHQRQIPMLVVPTGSGNDFAKALGIRNVDIAVRAWKQFCIDGKNVREIDLGVIRTDAEEVLFCCVAGVGMDAEANARANRMPAWLKGKGGYMLAALQSLIAFKPAEMSITATGREIRGPMFFIAAGNAQSYGGGMKVTPHATLDDGLLDICVVSKMNKLKLLCWVPTIFFGAHLRLKQVEYFQAKQIRIEAERQLDLYADGEFAGRTPVEIGIIPRGLRVIVPV
ncbi:MAG TPA: diacylglycerol kinase family protein [Candidatus Polarisedimenticolia bacterium]|jgi:diacylglycerol kinase (ATP)|nr:diacylglycerol kinase family protein [Candidatus Polarisedimenticolia bacterium]